MARVQDNLMENNGLSAHALGQELLKGYAEQLKTFRVWLASSPSRQPARAFDAERLASSVRFLRIGWEGIFNEAGDFSGLPDEKPYTGLMLRVTVLGDAITELLSYADHHGLWKRES
jgi:hypothetical protein